MIASRCVPFGIGSDIGGSVRIPCEFTGIYGFKGTSDRFSSAGSNTLYKDNFNPLTSAGGRIKAVIGSMGTSVDDLVIGTKVLLHPEAHRFDPFAPPCPFRDSLYDKARNGKVVIGYVESLPTVPASEASKRAVRMAKEALEKKGFKVVKFEFTVEEIGELRDVFTGLLANYNGIVTLNQMDAAYELHLPQYSA